MITHKELNQLVANLAGDAEVFELIRRDSDTIIKVSKVPEYATDLNLALEAAKRIADKNNYTFVLTYNDESYLNHNNWKAAFGDYKDCSEYSGGNPAYCICMSILQFMGKV